jgi:hypothetical protein
MLLLASILLFVIFVIIVFVIWFMLLFSCDASRPSSAAAVISLRERPAGYVIGLLSHVSVRHSTLSLFVGYIFVKVKVMFSVPQSFISSRVFWLSVVALRYLSLFCGVRRHSLGGEYRRHSRLCCFCVFMVCTPKFIICFSFVNARFVFLFFSSDCCLRW